MREPYLNLKLDEAPIASLVATIAAYEKAGLLLSNEAMYGQGREGFVRMNIGCPKKIVKEALERLLLKE